jgi:mono/diheme cytochrome c family protein
MRLTLAAALGAATLAAPTVNAQSLVERGKYLATIGDCVDCHTPGYFLGKPDMTRYLGGSDVGFELPDLGVFVGPNLTADKETGLGAWTDEQIATALTTGVRPDGRILALIMPWHALAQLTKPDLSALISFLRSLPPIAHKVPGPFGPSEKPTVFVMKLVPPEGAAPSGR